MVNKHAATIRRKMKSLGVYRNEYDQGITILAQLLDQYDELTKRFENSGLDFESLTNTGTKKAPIVTTLESLRKDILAYLNALGLTPAGAKKIDVQENKIASNALADALKKLGGDSG